MKISKLVLGVDIPVIGFSKDFNMGPRLPIAILLKLCEC